MSRLRQVIKSLGAFVETHPTFVKDVSMGDFEFDEDPIEVGCEYDQFESAVLAVVIKNTREASF